MYPYGTRQSLANILIYSISGIYTFACVPFIQNTKFYSIKNLRFEI